MASMRAVIVGELLKTEPFLLSPFPFRDGENRTRKGDKETNFSLKRGDTFHERKEKAPQNA